MSQTPKDSTDKEPDLPKKAEKMPDLPKKAEKVPGPRQTTDIPLDLGKPEHTLLNQKWLEGKSKEDLIALIFELALELKARTDKETEKIAASEARLVFRDVPDTDVKSFDRLPAVPRKKPDAVAEKTWRAILISSKREHELLSLEIYDDIVIGRHVPKGVRPDLDLTKHDGEELGVSRQHAILRPTQADLLLLDLGSTNGTFCNGRKLKMGEPHKLEDNDTISFGGLHFKIKFVSTFGEQAKGK